MPLFFASRKQTVSLGFSALLTLAAWVITTIPGLAVTWHVDQIGYHPDAPKRIVVEGVPQGFEEQLKVVVFDPEEEDAINIIMGTKGRPVYEGIILSSQPMANTTGPGFSSIVVDVSGWKKAGTYELHLQGLPNKTVAKTPFRVSEFTYWDQVKPILRSLYFFRSAMTIDDPNRTGIYLYPAHVNDGILLNPSVFDLTDEKDVTGGWYTSGLDLTKYVTVTAMTTSQMMLAYSWNPRPYKYLKLDYPMSEIRADRMPDLLYETKVGLDWILSMQRMDGGVFRKVGGQQDVEPSLLPDKDVQERFIFGVTTQDTAIAAATLAQAASVYKDQELGYSVKCLMAAELAWSYLQEKAPKMEISPDNRQDTHYLNTDTDMPYRLWAAIELYRATNKEHYHQYVMEHFNEVPLEVMDWKNPIFIGFMDYRFNIKPDQQNPSVVAAIDSQLNTLAQSVVASTRGNFYGISPATLTQEGNLSVLKNALVLLYAYRTSENKTLRSQASELVHYLFGHNPWNQTFVSGEGQQEPLFKPVEHPCHRVVMGTTKMIPGMVVEGPQPKTEASSRISWRALEYHDHPKSCKANSTALHWNATLGLTLSAMNMVYNTDNKDNEEPAGQRLPILPSQMER